MCYDLNDQKIYRTLSAENKKIVDLLLEGKNNKAIANELNMSVKTLEKKLTNLYALFDMEDKDKEKRTRLFVKIINFLRGKDQI
jgi:DNA-binding NarL/FixJ family response regulator